MREVSDAIWGAYAEPFRKPAETRVHTTPLSENTHRQVMTHNHNVPLAANESTFSELSTTEGNYASSVSSSRNASSHIHSPVLNAVTKTNDDDSNKVVVDQLTKLRVSVSTQKQLLQSLLLNSATFCNKNGDTRTISRAHTLEALAVALRSTVITENALNSLELPETILTTTTFENTAMHSPPPPPLPNPSQKQPSHNSIPAPPLPPPRPYELEGYSNRYSYKQHNNINIQQQYYPTQQDTDNGISLPMNEEDMCCPILSSEASPATNVVASRIRSARKPPVYRQKLRKSSSSSTYATLAYSRSSIVPRKPPVYTQRNRKTPSTSSTSIHKSSSSSSTIGRSVVLHGQGRALRGIVRFAGSVKFASGEWLGLELTTGPVGKHSGSVQGVKYFSCSQNRNLAEKLPYGIFVRPTQIKQWTS